MMYSIALLAFWLSLATLVYVYAGFSFLVMIAGKIRFRQWRREPITPRLSLIIPVWNEERTIAKKLENVLGLDYPQGALEIIVASDGSTDRTEAIVAASANSGIRLLRLPRRGKIHALKDAVAVATGEILVFTDANSICESDALRMLARNFADPEVGGVCGNQVYLKAKKADSSSKGERLYWAYDKWLKRMESLTGSIVSAHGAIYAIRRELYQPPVSAAVTDDFAISTAVIEQGYRLVFESEAVAYEEPASAASFEFGRKVRIMNRGLRAVLLRKRLLNPLQYGFYSLELFSHKVLRRLVPIFLFLLFVASLQVSSGGGFYAVAAVAQTLFYFSAGAGYVLRHHRLGHMKLLYIPFFYCLANAAALVAILKLLAGRRIERWQPQRHLSGA